MLQSAQKRCPAFSSVWLVGINFLYFLVGLILIGLSSWGITQQAQDSVTSALPAGGLVTIVIVGVFLVVVAVVGWAGVRFNSKLGGRYVLGIYATILIILMIMEFAAAGVLLAFTGRLNAYVPSFNGSVISTFIQSSYAQCCCGIVACPNGSCWLPGNLGYPCTSYSAFYNFLESYVDARIVPIGVIAIVIGIIQFFTAITACCNQCKGRKVEELKKIGGPLSYDGLYSEGEDALSGYGYESYVKTGGARAGGTGTGGARAGGTGTGAAAVSGARSGVKGAGATPAGAAAPRAGTGAAGRPAGGRAPAGGTRK